MIESCTTIPYWWKKHRVFTTYSESLHTDQTHIQIALITVPSRKLAIQIEQSIAQRWVVALKSIPMVVVLALEMELSTPPAILIELGHYFVADHLRRGELCC
jgi:hypothetical protein